MMHRNIALRLVAAASLALLGCGTSNGGAHCFVGADCASGACDVAGQCVPAVQPEGGALDAASPAGGDGSTAPEGSTDSSLPSTDGATAGCVPNNDGTITRDEVPMQVGLRATYLVAANATWDTTGTAGDAGSRTWDLTGALPGDQTVIFEALSPTGAWWASSFPAATFSMRLTNAQTLQGIFQVTSETLSLIGVVSPTSAAPSTEVSYGTSVPTLQFPLTVGASWGVTSNVTGTVSGVLANYTEQYASKVDASGQMRTPYGTFTVMRVGTVLTQTVGLVATVTRSFTFIAECVGPVASVTSQSNASTTEFSNDAEVRRLSP